MLMSTQSAGKHTAAQEGKELFRRSWRAHCSGSLISRCAPLSQIANEIMRARHTSMCHGEGGGGRRATGIPLGRFKNRCRFAFVEEVSALKIHIPPPPFCAESA